MLGWICGAVLVEAALVLSVWRWGYNGGVVDTEVRWSAAVARAEHEILRAAGPAGSRRRIENCPSCFARDCDCVCATCTRARAGRG